MATMKVLVALVAVCSMMSTEGKVLEMLDYHKILSSMFSESCAALIPGHSGLNQLKGELKRCYRAKNIPEPGELELTGVPVGLEGVFPGEYIYASSSRDDHSQPQRGRLNTIKTEDLNGAWCSEVNNDIQFFQVDLGALHSITGIVTQGDHNELNWIRTYTLEVSTDGTHWGCVFGSDGRVKVFNANEDSDSPVTNVMNPVILTRYIRIIPKSWTNHICLRAEIYVKEILPRKEVDPKPIPDFETQLLGVNPKRPEALIVKSYAANQIDTGMVPEEWTDKRQAPPKSISFEYNKKQPQLFQVQPAGVVGSPLNPIDVDSLVITGGGPIVDRVHPGTPSMFELPRETRTFGGVEPVYTPEFEWYPLEFDTDMYIEISFGFPVDIRGISTKGRPGLMEWVIEYKIMYLNPYLNKWVWLHDEEHMDDLRITANDDDSSPRDHIYSPAIFTSRLRLYILRWNNKPAMQIKLFLGTVPREEAQIVTGPVYEGNLFSWAWTDKSAAEGVTQEIYFTESLTLVEFGLKAESTIENYKLQYLVATDQWREYVDGENTVFSKGEPLRNFNGVRAEGIRISAISWEEEAQFFAQFNLRVKEDIPSGGVVRDIIELSSHFMYFKWEDSNSAAGSAVFFDLGEEHQLTRIETKGLDGVFAKEYKLECRAHYEQQGTITVLAGNTNDEDIVEHLLNLQCKYVLIRPNVGGISMEVYLYSDIELTGARAKVLSPGSRGGNFEGEWNPPQSGGTPYLEFIFNHHITPTKITLEAMEGSSVEEFKLQRSDDEENFESVLGTDNQIQMFPMGTSEFEASFELRALRILPIDNGGGIGFKYNIEFLAETKVKVSVNPFAGEQGAPADPRSVLSANYNSEGAQAGQYVRIVFHEAEMVHKFYMNKPVLGSTITSFNLFYKARSDDQEFTQIEKDGETNIPGNKKKISVELGDLEVAELKIVILASEGDGVKFGYGLELSGSIGGYDVLTAFDDAQAANPAQ